MAGHHRSHDGHDHHHDHSGAGGAQAAAMGVVTDPRAMDALDACCAHEAQIEKNLVLYSLGGVLVLTTAVANWLNLADPLVAKIPAAIGAVVLGIPLLKSAWDEIRSRKASSATLAAVAILAAIATEEYVAAGLLAFILLVVGLLIRRSAFGAQRAIAALVSLTPAKARVLEEGVEREIPVSQVKVGQTVRVRPGENLPVDGKIASGRSTINQAALTGESAPVEAAAGDAVYAGTSNLTGALDVLVTQIGGQTTIGKVMNLIRSAQQSRGDRELLIERVASFFVPIALSIAAVMWFIKSQNPATKDDAALTAITVLVVACPVSLVLASPTAMLAAFASAARLGVMIKAPQHLEAAGNVNTVVMDKTGTITTGKFQVTKLAPAEGVDGAELLAAAVNGEQHSNHPLAQSILATGKAARIQPDGTNDYEEIHGRGVRARTSVGQVHVGRSSWLAELNPDIRPQVEAVAGKIEGMTGVHVMRDGRYLGAVGLEDTVRPNTRAVIARLRDLGVKHIAIFTGDRLSVARRVGQTVGVDMIEAECLPEEKHEQIIGLTKSGHRVMMIGDGINDGPSLAEADVGVAMGLSGTDIAANSAGVALMNDDLSRVPYLIELSRRTRTIIGQNVAASIVIVIIGLTLAATGTLARAGEAAVALAAFYHFAGEIFVLANSFRLFRFGEEIVEAEQTAEPALKRRSASVRGFGQPQTA
jgi:heavy metal translocating P-type ATPase